MPDWIQQFIHYTLPEFKVIAEAMGRTLGEGFVLAAAVLITRFMVNEAWERRIVHHLPELARQEIEEAHAEADHYKSESERLDAECNVMRAACRGAQNITSTGLRRAKNGRAN